MPVEAPAECEVRTAQVQLYADAGKKARVHLPPGATLRKCSAAREGAQVVTKPDSGGTTACVFYEFTVDAKNPEVQLGARKTAIAKSLTDKSCPAIDFKMQSYPGKDWFFLSDNVPLENAYRVKARIETGGLAFLQEEKKAQKDPKSALDFGNSPLGVYSISAAAPSECRTKQSFFQARHSACYMAVIYNQTVRGGWSMRVALLKNGEYKITESNRLQ